MARLYVAAGDGIARLDENGEAWTVELSLPGRGAQCLAVDPTDPDVCGEVSLAGTDDPRLRVAMGV